MDGIGFARKSLAGKSVFEVPVIRTDFGNRPRAPKCAGFSAFYLRDSTRCFIVCQRGTASYMEKRKYARYMGVAFYNPASPIASGLSHTVEDWPQEAQ